MHRLVLMRHAKSDWGDPGLGDHDRPLNDRGRRAAPRMGAWLAAQGAFPDAALLSSARRVQETWAGVLDGAGRTASPPPARTERGLYL
ncbi:MAG: histidine phosphatase family protein, partial [Pseudomonadota bacterium]|nr:histidine phosphatase family protein [Pseudomonadota bacterium]